MGRPSRGHEKMMQQTEIGDDSIERGGWTMENGENRDICSQTRPLREVVVLSIVV